MKRGNLFCATSRGGHESPIIAIPNYAWERSFDMVISNKKVIAERGWFPYNHNLMTYPIIRSSIVKEDEEAKLTKRSNVVLPL